jgi:hypothetical protein
MSDVGDDHSLRSSFGLVIVFLARRRVSTTQPKARSAHLVTVGHVNMATKLDVEAGLEHGRGDVDAGRLCCTRVTSGEYNWTTRSTGHETSAHRAL